MPVIPGQNVRLMIDGHEIAGGLTYEQLMWSDSSGNGNHAIHGSVRLDLTPESRKAIHVFLTNAECPRPRTWVVISVRFGITRQHGTVTAWTEKGVRRKLRKLSRVVDEPRLHALDPFTERVLEVRRFSQGAIQRERKDRR